MGEHVWNSHSFNVAHHWMIAGPEAEMEVFEEAETAKQRADYWNYNPNSVGLSRHAERHDLSTLHLTFPPNFQIFSNASFIQDTALHTIMRCRCLLAHVGFKTKGFDCSAIMRQ